MKFAKNIAASLFIPAAAIRVFCNLEPQAAGSDYITVSDMSHPNAKKAATAYLSSVLIHRSQVCAIRPIAEGYSDEEDEAKAGGYKFNLWFTPKLGGAFNNEQNVDENVTIIAKITPDDALIPGAFKLVGLSADEAEWGKFLILDTRYIYSNDESLPFETTASAEGTEESLGGEPEPAPAPAPAAKGGKGAKAAPVEAAAAPAAKGGKGAKAAPVEEEEEAAAPAAKGGKGAKAAAPADVNW